MLDEKQLFSIQVIDWNNSVSVADLKKVYGQKLTDTEFDMFLKLCVSTGLNPFLKEVWAIKYDEKVAAQIFISRDGYRRVIGNHPGYRGRFIDAVYSGDDFGYNISSGEVIHTRNFKDRGTLIGAYCVVMMEGKVVPYYSFVNFNEYNLGNAIWKSKPETMLKKVAESQAIRMACYDQLSGTYTPDEVPPEMLRDKKPAKSIEVNRLLGLGHQAQDMSVKFEVKKPELMSIEASSKVIDKETNSVVAEMENTEMFSFHEVKEMLSSAKTRHELLEAVDLISTMDISEGEKSELRAVYKERNKDIA